MAGVAPADVCSGRERGGAAAGAEPPYPQGVADAPVLKHLFDSEIRNEIESEDTRVFALYRAGGFRFQESEIDEIRFWPPEKLFDAHERENFTPNLCAELDKLREIGLI